MKSAAFEKLFSALVLAAGIALAGWFVADALYRVKASSRFVSVKGLAEREVPADLVIWPVSFVVTGDDLAAVYARIEADGVKVKAFMKSMGIKENEIEEATPAVVDFLARGYSGQAMPKNRYKVTQRFTVRSGDVRKVINAMGKAGRLVKQGVVIDEGFQNVTKFMFTGLNSIKPAMIAEATGNARKAAEKFARDSGSRVGAIKGARQGFFSITDRDMYTPEIKRVRVVTSVDYFLE